MKEGVVLSGKERIELTNERIHPIKGRIRHAIVVDDLSLSTSLL